LFLFPDRRIGGDVRRFQSFFFVFEKDFLRALRAAQVDYLIVGKRERFLSLYLRKVGWAEMVFKNDEALIYRIDTQNIAPMYDFTSIISDESYKKLHVLEEKYPFEYDRVRRVLSYFGISDTSLIKQSTDSFNI